MDRGFILLLLLTSLTGLALLAGRDTAWMAILLAIHLGVVMALSDHSLRKICPRILPLRSLTQVGD